MKSIIIEVKDDLHQKLKEKAVKKKITLKQLITPSLEALVK